MSFWENLGDNDRAEKALWAPDALPPGVLDSAEIRRYVEKCGLISPFNEDQLGPASYELTLGPLYYNQGRCELTESSPDLEVPRNSLIFISFQEILRLPHYMVARFGLNVTMLYRGLLLGAGPQVDPGFMGALSCPIHNISNQAFRLRLGEPLARIEFTKTTFATDHDLRDHLATIDSEKELYKFADANPKLAPLFPQRLRWREPIFAYTGDRVDLASSVAGLSLQVSDAEKTVRRYTRYGFIGVIAALIGFLGVLFALIELGTSYVDRSTDNGQVVERVQRLEERTQGYLRHLTQESHYGTASR